jgi:hypothetical protein
MRSLILGSLVVGVVAIGVLLSLIGPGSPREPERGKAVATLGAAHIGPPDPTSPVAPAAGWESAPGATPLSLSARGSTLPGVSSLWTPEGEHPVEDERRTRPPAVPPPGLSGDEGPDDEAALAADLDELRRQLAATAPEVVVANHAFGLFELAALHLSQQPPHLEAARLAVDAMGALVEGLAGRLGEAEEPLTSALAQIRMAYVQIGGATRAGTGDGSGTEAAAGTGTDADAPGTG